MSATWGSLTEQYTKKCMDILHYRYCYYVLAKPLISDGAYDILEKELINFELKHPNLKHPNSPTGYAGSDKKETYPDSIRRLYEKDFMFSKKSTKATLW